MLMRAGNILQEIVVGDCLDVLQALRADCIDAVLTDPPYELGFMAKPWDASGIAYCVELWSAIWRVLKPGGHLLAFGGTRTYHRMTCAIEDAGFQIRDCLQWLYGSGFPKSLNIGEGRGTALKPACEPIVLARKPLDGCTVAANVQKWGTGALNIDGCRIESGERPQRIPAKRDGNVYGSGLEGGIAAGVPSTTEGRWPANVLLDETAAAALDAQSGILHPSGSARAGKPNSKKDKGSGSATSWNLGERKAVRVYSADSGGASRFFYVAKASRKEREAGCEHLPAKTAGEATDREDGSDGLNSPRAGAGRTGKDIRNHHPTVKPISLMRYLIRLVTPPGGIVLDPFCGSGSTGVAAVQERTSFLGIEKEDDYAKIARARIIHAQIDTENGNATETERNTEAEAETEGDQYGDSNDDISDEDGERAMAQLPKALADKVGDARTAGGGNFVQHGDYVMMIKSWFYQNIQDECIILEIIPVEARKKTVYEGQKKVEQDPNPPGSECVSVANFSSEAKLSAPANSRAPALGLFGFKEGEVPNAKVSDTLQYVTSDAQPAKGMLLACSTFPKEIRSKKGSYITGLNWACVARPGTGVNSPDAVRARLDAWTRGPEELIKVAMEQLNQARAAGAAPALADVSEASPSATPAPASSPAVGSAAATPGTPPPSPSPVIDRLAGWTANPNDPNWYYRFVEGKPEQKLKTDLLAGR